MEVEGKRNASFHIEYQEKKEGEKEVKRQSVGNTRHSDSFVELDLPRPSLCIRALVRVIHCLKYVCCSCHFRRRVALPDEEGPGPIASPSNSKIVEYDEHTINALDNQSRTPIFCTLQAAQNYIEEGENPPLHKVYWFIEHGADLTLSREKGTGRSFFHLATQFPSLIAHLIEKEKIGDINSYLDNQGSTPLGYAFLLSQKTTDNPELAGKFLESAKLLLESTGRLDCATCHGEASILHYVVEKRIVGIFPLNRQRDDLNSVSKVGKTPLCYALYLDWMCEFLEEKEKSQKPAVVRQPSITSVAGLGYLQIAKHLFSAQAKIAYTNEGISERLQYPFRGFVEDKGYQNALLAD